MPCSAAQTITEWNNSVMKRILKYLKPYRGKLALATVMVSLSSLCDLLLPTLMSDILNSGIRSGDFLSILRTCIQMLIVASVSLGSILLGTKTASEVVASFCADLRADIFRKVNTLSFEEFGNLGTAALVTRAPHDVDTVSWIASMLCGTVATIPMLFVIYISFMTRGTFGGVEYVFSIDSYQTLLDVIYFKVIAKSFRVAVVTTVLCLLVGYPFAYYIARKPPEVASRLIMLIMIPFWTNSLMRLNAWMLLFQANGPVNHALMALGLTAEPIKFIYTDWLVMLGLITNMLPFAVLPMYASIEKLQKSMLEASADLGAKPSVTFLRVTLPLTFPGIFSAIILTFIPALGIYTVTDMLGGGKVLYIGNIIKNQFGAIRNWPLGAALSVLLLAITALLIFVYMRFAKLEDMEVV